MDAKLQKIQIIPVKLDSDGDVQKPETAAISLEVPLDSISQKEAIVGLLDMLSNEWITVVITGKQLRLDLEARKTSEMLSERETADIAEGQQSAGTAMEMEQ